MLKNLLILGALSCACVLAQSNPPMLSQSTLTANVLATGNGPVSISAPFPFSPSAPLNQGVIYMDSEAMLVLSANLQLNQLSVQRGYLGTTIAAHNAGALAFSGQPFQFISTDKSGSCDPNSPQYLNVTDQLYFTCTAGSWVSASTSNGGSGGSGTVTNIATSAPLTGGPISTTGTLGCRTATGSLSGCISAADWTTFNAKQSALTLPLSVANGGTGTASPALVAGTNVTITGSFPNQTINSTGGGGSGWTITTISGLPGTCPSAGAGYFVTDAPPGQQLYLCADNASAPYQFLNLGGSTCLAFTAASLDIVTACIPQKTLANDFTALNRFGAIAGMGSAPTRTNVTGTVAVNAGSTNASGTITSSTSGTVLFTFTMAGVTFATRPVCMFHDDTTNADQIGTTQSTPPTTSAMTVTGTTASGDIISYICIGH